jgi:hypothetical protein
MMRRHSIRRCNRGTRRKLSKQSQPAILTATYLHVCAHAFAHTTRAREFDGPALACESAAFRSSRVAQTLAQPGRQGLLAHESQGKRGHVWLRDAGPPGKLPRGRPHPDRGPMDSFAVPALSGTPCTRHPPYRPLRCKHGIELRRELCSRQAPDAGSMSSTSRAGRATTSNTSMPRARPAKSSAAPAARAKRTGTCTRDGTAGGARQRRWAFL